MLHVHPPHPAGEATPHPQAVWLDLVTPDEGEVSLVEDLLGFRLPTRDQLSGIEQSSRLSFDDGVLRMAAPVVAESDTDHPRISPIGVILTPQLMISVRYDTLFMFESVGRMTGPDAPATSAAAFAAVMQERARLSGKRAGVIFSGGNIDMPVFAKILRGETPAV